MPGSRIVWRKTLIRWAYCQRRPLCLVGAGSAYRALCQLLLPDALRGMCSYPSLSSHFSGWSVVNVTLTDQHGTFWQLWRRAHRTLRVSFGLWPCLVYTTIAHSATGIQCRLREPHRVVHSDYGLVSGTIMSYPWLPRLAHAASATPRQSQFQLSPPTNRMLYLQHRHRPRVRP